MELADVLRYAAAAPMTELRQRFNRGEDLHSETPPSIPADEALEDLSFVRLVLREAYSGYSCYAPAQFDRAFDEMERAVRGKDTVTANELIDCIAGALSFLCDGHLSLTTRTYGRGFYRKRQTYVADLVIAERDGRYVDAASGAAVGVSGGVRLFPTLPEGGERRFLVGARSEQPLTEIALTVNGREKQFPVHPIRSRPASEEILLREEYGANTAYIACSTLVGDAEEDLARFERAGERCRAFRYVIWDLSNNLGGNSEFPRRFLKGLTGACAGESGALEVRSALTHAKETGELRDIPYQLACVEPAQAQTDGGLFSGTLFVVVNDHVASSGESAVAMASAVEGTVLCGCSTLGIGRFGDLCVYELPRSHVLLWCPQKVFPRAPEETVGFEPDLWLDSTDPAACLRRALGLE